MNMLSAALQYAERRWCLFPQDRNKHPCISDWPNRATCEPKEVRQLFQQYPKANVAMTTGARSGILVLDIDVKNNQPGLKSLEKLEEIFGPLRTFTTLTPSGGKHLFFRHPGNGSIRNKNSIKGYPGIELKADGGCVTLPPSFYISGAQYRSDEDQPDELIDLPPTLMALLTDGNSSPTSTENNQKMSVGERHNHLLSIAGKLRNAGLDPEIIFSA